MAVFQPDQTMAAATYRLTPLDGEIMHNIELPLSTDIRICHFIPVRHFHSLMKTGSLSFCRCDKFKDVADGLLPTPNKTRISPTMTRLYEELGKTPIDAQGRTLRFEHDPAEEYHQQEIA